MSPSASQPVGAAPGGLEPTTGGREPLPSGGSPPGAPPERPLFQSALESERARTATAEGQQQSRSPTTQPAGGEPASTAEAFDRTPHGSQRLAPRHSGHPATPPPAGTKAPAGFVSSAPTPAGSTPIPATTLPGSNPTGELVVGVTGELTVGTTGGSAVGTTGGSADGSTGGSAVDATAGPAEGSTGKRTAGASTVPAKVSTSASAMGADGTSSSAAPTTTGSSTHTDGALTATSVTHEDTPLFTPTGPVAAAAAGDGASTAGALATSRDGSPDAGRSAGALATAAKDVPIASDGVPMHSMPAGPPAGAHFTPRGFSTLSTSTGNAGAHDKLWVTSPAQAASDGTANGSGLSENTASLLMPAAADGDPAAMSGELGAAGYGLGLQEAIESLHGTIQLAARQGLTQARISLQPEELGEIRINLTQTAQGLLARVTAESPAAAQALAAAHVQLRQSLSSLGINLARLDIGHHEPAQSGGADTNGSGQGSAARGEGFAGSRPSRSTAIAAPADPETETDAPADEAPTPSTTAPAHETLIDVLA